MEKNHVFSKFVLQSRHPYFLQLFGLLGGSCRALRNSKEGVGDCVTHCYKGEGGSKIPKSALAEKNAYEEICNVANRDRHFST